MKSLLSNCSISVTGRWAEFGRSARSCASGAGRVDVEGLSGSSAGFFAAGIVDSVRDSVLAAFSRGSVPPDPSSLDFLVVVPSERDVRDVRVDMETALGSSVEFHELPWWSSASYKPLARGASVFGRRAGVLSLMLGRRPVTQSSRPRVFISCQRAVVAPLPPASSFSGREVVLSEGQSVDTVRVASLLSGMGYVRVPRVCVAGEFTLRGEVLDVFPPERENPVRVNFDFDEIRSVKEFDAETQGTRMSVGSVHVGPMKEVVWDGQALSRVREAFAGARLSGEAEARLESMLGELSSSGECEGEELLYPAIWDEPSTVVDYMGRASTVLLFDYERLDNAQESLSRELEGMFRKVRPSFPALPPGMMAADFRGIVARAEERLSRTVALHAVHGSGSDSGFISMAVDAPQSFFGNFAFIRERFESLQAEGWRIIIFADNANQCARLQEVFRDFRDGSEQAAEKMRANSARGVPFYPVEILPEAISAGFGIPQAKVLVVQENELFGRRKQAALVSRRVKSEAIDTFVELEPGDYVVHVNYGIGRFKGIQRLASSESERDFIKIEYAGEEFLYIPLEQLNLVQRYIGNGGDSPRLDTIGGKSWENRKGKVKKAVEEMAEKLVTLYGKRKVSRGFAFARWPDLEAEFDAAFPYEDTPDQCSVTREIKDDMERPVPMDRLLCGDVGYGKTEVAMRAAFKAVLSKKQVAFLAPTTILAEQHFETCVERFANFPVVIKQLSRFVAPKERKETLAALAAGQVDIIVGTHRLLQKDVVFRDLGLMIIDEEQRFGVKDKERLKTMRTNIDCLSMSATPIPRTLHMSLLKIRDMSLLTTPPQTRKPIETFVDAYDDEKVARAIRNEVERGGQVFFLHNRVETLQETCRTIERLVPEVLVDFAHGQMSAEELDDIFRRFKMGGFHVLVATTIIENGIDIPNVNTIIIDRADMYGISQLYQLRGRVGRSDRKAFAYLLYPGNKVLSEVAMKRLQAISDFTELGSGFKIAMKDMEIRGAGNLLGRDQSGDVYSVGFDMYVRLLTDAINRLTKEGYKEERDVLIELEYSGFIPDTYVHSVQTKMEIYKKVAAVQTKEELAGLCLEIEDRFGPIPDEVYSLMSLAEVRIIARRLSVDSLKEKGGTVRVSFRQASDIPVDKFMRLLAGNPAQVKADFSDQKSFLLVCGKIGLKEKGEFIKEKLEALL